MIRRSWRRTLGASFMIGLAMTAGRAPADVINPGFEDGLDGWTVEGSEDVTTDPLVPPPTSGGIAGDAQAVPILFGIDDATDVLPTQGDLFALIGTDGVTATRLLQSFVVPVLGPGLQLSYDFRFMTDEIDSGPDFNDSLLVEVLGDGDVSLLSHRFSRDDLQPGGDGPLTGLAIEGVGGYAAGTAWLTRTFDLTPYAGQGVTLSFTIYDVGDDGVLSAASIDNIRLQVIPEPSSVLMAGLGALGVVVAARRRRR